MNDAGNKILIIEAPFYKDIVGELSAGAQAALEAAGYGHETISVPGVYEIPAALAMAWNGPRSFAGVVTLGCVVRGETDHYEFISRSALDELMRLITEYRIPHGLGILTVENGEQARVRADRKQKNLGGRAAEACLTMLALGRRLAE